MIAKKVASSKTKAKASSIRDLVKYIRESDDPGKVLYSGARGFLCDDSTAQREEMVALAAEAVRSKNPVNHYILSWREGEQPSPDQIEEAVSIFLEELGLTGHQVIYAAHKDTDNIHLHIAVNRVHPETHKVVEINKGFDLEAAHRAIARIEHTQGWQREQHGRYQILEDGELVQMRDSRPRTRRPSQKQRDVEHRTGAKSALRIAIEQGAEIIRRAQTWEQLHRELAAKGMRYEKTGSGATVFVGDVAVKASAVSRDASLAKMQKRLGEYRPASGLQIAQRAPEPVHPIPGWEEYITVRKAHYAEKKAAKAAMDRRHEQERMALIARQKARRDELMRGNWKGKGEALNALRSVLAAEQASERAALKERQRAEREQWRKTFPPYPDFEQWLRMQHHPELAERWRYRASEPQRIEGPSDELPIPRDIRSYTPQIIDGFVYYTRHEDGSGPAFVDRGRNIEVFDGGNEDAVLAALQLAAQKWGSFTVHGSDEFKALCVKLAAEHGFRIANPELQASIRQERERIQRERTQAMKSEQLRLFERYAEAVGAERYRVTSIKMYADGRKQVFVLDKKNGITRGFTPQEMAQHIPEMIRMQRSGENIYYTPLSDAKHHILIDNMNREKLERLIRDGYQPAAVLESSPGNYQAIITIPKLGTPHDRDVGNRLSEALNREYGDPKLSGAIHSHHAPGFESRKPKYPREDGSYPVVRLLKAEARTCAKAMALARQIDAEYQRQAASQAQQRAAARLVAAPVTATDTSGGSADVYYHHYRDILRMLRGEPELDLSRVDAMIAVRLRVTGHDQAAIESIIRQCAPTIRSKDDGRRDWNDYARRTARFAFSPEGDLQAAYLSQYRRQWERLEGRESVHQREIEIECDESPGISL